MSAGEKERHLLRACEQKVCGCEATDGANKKEKLRAIRHERGEFDPRFFEKHSLFWPIVRAASTFVHLEDWPDVSAYADAYRGSSGDDERPVRFQEAPIKRKRPPGLIIRDDLYDATIVKRRTVPTRARMWHDYLNALVWMTFPHAKLALHKRQHAAIEKWIPEGATQLPNARTRELDALALVDEGGVLILENEKGEEQQHILFGHALFEGLVFEQRAMVARAVVLRVDAAAVKRDPNALKTEESSIRLADQLLARRLDDCSQITSPEELGRQPL